ncbi:MAG: LysM peptidoglycan-binding domain-containing protein [Akkermansiaceae bacterium]
MKIVALYFLAASLLVSPICGQTESDIEFLRARADAHERKISQLEQDLSRLKALLADRSFTAVVEKTRQTTEPAFNVCSNSKTIEYVVKPGDILSRIATAHQTTVTAICLQNKLTSDRIVVGQKLAIPESRGSKATGKSPTKLSSQPVEKPTKHKVQSGETLHSVAKIYGISIESLKQANPNVEPTKMRVGQVLLIDGRVKQSSRAVLPDHSAQIAKAQEGMSIGSSAEPASRDPKTISADPNAAPSIKTITVDRQITYGKFATIHGASTSQLNELNGLSLSGNTTLAKGSELYVPQF